jgi:hypothetical protein
MTLKYRIANFVTTAALLNARKPFQLPIDDGKDSSAFFSPALCPPTLQKTVALLLGMLAFAL